MRKKSPKSLKYTEKFLLSTNVYYLKVYIIAIYNCKEKTSNFSKTRQDLPSLFFSLQINEIYEKLLFQLVLATLKIALASSTLQQNGCKTRLPQKNILGGVHSYYNSSFKIFKSKVQINAVYGDVYSIAQVLLISQSGCFCDAFQLFSE